MKNLSKDNILKTLKNPFFTRQVVSELLNTYHHELIQKPRLFFEQNTKGSRYIPSYDALKKQHPEVDEEDLWELMDDYEDFDDGHYDTHGQYYRRDTFLTGAAVTSVILKHLTGFESPINDIDLFFYCFKATTNAAAEHERYNNLQGEDAVYHICKVKEHDKLNLIEINIEDNFSWIRLLDSFDLNYAQVGIILAEGQLIYSDKFVEFLQTKLISLSGIKDDHPMTTYLRGVQKSSDFDAKFYLLDHLRPFLMEAHGEELLQENCTEITVTPDRDIADDEGHLLVTKKRYSYWLKNPKIIPYLTPCEVLDGNVKDEKILGTVKINLPEELWVDNCRNVFTMPSKKTGNYRSFSHVSFFSKISKIVPNFYNPRQTQVERLKSLLHSNLLAAYTPLNSEYSWVQILRDRPQLLKEDFAYNRLAAVNKFIPQHEGFLQELSWFCLNNNYSINDLTTLLNHLSNWDMGVLGTLEALGFSQVGHNSAKTSYSPNPERDYNNIYLAILGKNYSSLYQEVEKYYLKNLEKNYLNDPLEINPFTKYVTEITQADKLILEARIMHHCVDGFATRIRNNTSRIFHICIEGNHSTLEVGVEWHNPQTEVLEFKHLSQRYRETFKTEKPKKLVKGKVIPLTREQEKDLGNRKLNQRFRTYTWNQHQAYNNQKPHRLNNLVAKKLIEYLNQYHPRYQMKLIA